MRWIVFLLMVFSGVLGIEALALAETLEALDASVSDVSADRLHIHLSELSSWITTYFAHTEVAADVSHGAVPFVHGVLGFGQDLHFLSNVQLVHMHGALEGDIPLGNHVHMVYLAGCSLHGLNGPELEMFYTALGKFSYHSWTLGTVALWTAEHEFFVGPTLGHVFEIERHRNTPLEVSVELRGFFSAEGELNPHLILSTEI